MFNHMCLVITTAIFADFVADFLTPVKTNIAHYENCLHNTGLEKLFCKHVVYRGLQVACQVANANFQSYDS